jgi:diacylglycerol kinase family enzyme
MASQNDVIVVAGGDGTFSDIINTVETAETTLAFLPLGTGNALRHALGYKGNLRDVALQIKEGNVRSYDLIDCDDKRRAYIASVGIEGHILSLRDQYRRCGIGGFAAYAMALLRAYIKDYMPAAAHIQVNDSTLVVKRLLTLMIMKQPFYGFGLNVAPHARFDDGKLHTVAVPSGSIGALWGLATSLTSGNRTGHHETGHSVCLSLDRPLGLQTDGNRAWESDRFVFSILPGSLKIKH